MKHIMERCQEELIALLVHHRQAPFLQYLFTNWNNTDELINWGRRNEGRGIPFARSTMFFEAHSSTLKRAFLKFHNRPRPYFLLF